MSKWILKRVKLKLNVQIKLKTKKKISTSKSLSFASFSHCKRLKPTAPLGLY